VQAKITKSSALAVSRSLVIVTKFRAPGCGDFYRTMASKKGIPYKRRYFDHIGSPSVKTVANRWTHVAYHNKHWWQAF